MSAVGADCHEDGLDAAAVDGLTRLTVAHKRAAYAPAAMSTEAAGSALKAAEAPV